MVNREFEEPSIEVVRFNNVELIATSGVCYMPGTTIEIDCDDDEVCPSEDAECTCYPDASVNCY